MFKISDLKTENLRAPNAVDVAKPRFSWKLSEGVQKSYHIVATSGGEILWDSKVVDSDKSMGVRYEGRPLQSREEVSWSVTVTAQFSNGTCHEATETASFYMGLLNRDDWMAKWIEAEETVDAEADKPAIYLKKTFHVKPGLVKAKIYQTAHGLYHFYMNGRSGTEDLFKPGLTSYYHRIQYQMYDVKELLQEGENTWSVILADGWWRGATGGTVRNNFGEKLAFIGQLELYYEDGSRETIVTDDSFTWTTGPLLSSDMMMGDVYDAGAWYGTYKNVHEIIDSANLIASMGVPVRAHERFTPEIITDANGSTVLDFGQNIAGFVSMRLRNTAAGQVVHLTHGEGLREGVFCMENMNDTSLKLKRFQEVFYTCRGDEVEEYCPQFSVFGFRYVLLEGYENPMPEDFTAIAVYSDMEETGRFICSHPLINKLVSNSMWSQKGNFLDVAVDCPTRERNAWTGDAQVYVRTSAILMDTLAFYEKWLKDQTIEQYASGKVGITFPSTSSPHLKLTYEKMKQTAPQTALAGPEGNGSIGEDAVGWGDSAVWLPYMVYQSYGDEEVLINQYETAKRWLEYELAQSKNHNPKYKDLPQYKNVGEDGVLDGEYIYDTNFQYGEWNEAIEKTPEEQAALYKMVVRAKQEGRHLLEIMAEDGKPEVATAYVYRSAKAVSYMAGVLKKTDDAKKYDKLAERIKGVYCNYFIAEDGMMEKGHQAPYVRALNLGLYRDEKQKQQLLDKLVEEIHANDDCLNTGFLSTPYLLPVLADNGYAGLAYKILGQTKNPSWLHAVEMGATTILEEWAGLDKFKASFNHYSYGAVCEFLFAYIAGIRLDYEAPGYKHFILKPVVDESLSHASGSIETPYGKIVSGWKRENGALKYNCTVPANTTATLILPDGQSHELGYGEYQYVM